MSIADQMYDMLDAQYEELCAAANENAISHHDQQYFDAAADIIFSMLDEEDDQVIEDWFTNYASFDRKSVHCHRRIEGDTVIYIATVQNEDAYSGYDYYDEPDTYWEIGRTEYVDDDTAYRNDIALSALLTELANRIVG